MWIVALVDFAGWEVSKVLGPYKSETEAVAAQTWLESVGVRDTIQVISLDDGTPVVASEI